MTLDRFMKMGFNRNFIGPSVRQHKITLLIIRDLDRMTLKASICCYLLVIKNMVC